MSLTIELTPGSEQRLMHAAKQAGFTPEEYGRRMIEALPEEIPVTPSEETILLEGFKQCTKQADIIVAFATTQALVFAYATGKGDLFKPIKNIDLRCPAKVGFILLTVVAYAIYYGSIFILRRESNNIDKRLSRSLTGLLVGNSTWIVRYVLISFSFIICIAALAIAWLKLNTAS